MSLAPRYRSPLSPPPLSQRRAASPSRRCSRRPSRSSSSQARSGRPFADQHLVGDLRRAVAERDQPRVAASRSSNASTLPREAPCGHELVDPHPAPRVLDSRRRARSCAGRRRAASRALVGRERVDESVGGCGRQPRPRRRWRGSRSTVRVRPSRRSQVARSAWESSGSAPGSPATSRRTSVDQPRLEPQAGEPRRLGDRAAQLVVAHRAEQDLVAGDRSRELADARSAAP